MKLKGRTALVTGASRGIGRAVALALAEEGADVAVNYVSSEAAANDVAEQIRKMGRRATLAQADVADFPDTFRMAQETLKEFGHLDILVNNAGINSDKTFVKMDHASWRKVLAINLDGVFNCTKVFIDQMLRQGYGRVVNMTSVIGQIGNFGQANYAASKAGVAAFTKSLAKELAGKGVTVNAIAPGFIETEMVRGIPDKVKEKLLAQIPLKRFGTAEEVARAVCYIVSTDGDYITGAELSMNAGLLMRPSPIMWAPSRRDVAAPRRCGPRGARCAPPAPRSAWRPPSPGCARAGRAPGAPARCAARRPSGRAPAARGPDRATGP